MAEYIEREAALQALVELIRDKDEVFPTDLTSAIQVIPTADVRPVVKARWKPVMCAGNPNIQDRDELYGPLFVCDKCNRTMIGKSNFCPNCGADMRDMKNEKA